MCINRRPVPLCGAQGVDFDFFLGQKVSLLVPPKRIIDNETQHALNRRASLLRATGCICVGEGGVANASLVPH